MTDEELEELEQKIARRMEDPNYHFEFKFNCSYCGREVFNRENCRCGKRWRY